MPNPSRSIHTRLARELTPEELNQVSGADGETGVSGEPTWQDSTQWYDTTPRADADGYADYDH